MAGCVLPEGLVMLMMEMLELVNIMNYVMENRIKNLNHTNVMIAYCYF